MANTDFWAVSQASPLRRVHINGLLSLMHYCGAGPYYASGGFIADSEFTGSSVTNGSQQQWVTRNSNLDGWSNGVWNQVFCGDNGAPAQNFGNGGVYTTLASCTVTEEEPFLYTDSQGNYNVFVPAVQHNSSGPAWASGTEAGTSVPLSKFFVASPGTSGAAMTAAMARGLNLILTPGVYDLNQPIVVPHPDTVVLGLGMATLVPQHGNAAMIVVPNSGVKLSGLIIDAGPVNSPVLLSVGTPGPGNASDPDLIQDVFFRIGGAETTPVSATVSLLDNASNSIIDNIWAWRADHGNAVGWTVNKADTGVVVTGNNVTAYGLAVEHYQKNEVIWSGQGGTESIIRTAAARYDPPRQTAGIGPARQPGQLPGFPGHRQRQELPGYGMGNSIVSFNAPSHLAALASRPPARRAAVPQPRPRFWWHRRPRSVIIAGLSGTRAASRSRTPVNLVSSVALEAASAYSVPLRPGRTRARWRRLRRGLPPARPSASPAPHIVAASLCGPARRSRAALGG